MRFSQFKQQDYTARLFETPNELGSFLERMVDAGVDIFHCSTRRFWEPEFPDSELTLAGWTKKLSGQPVITVGSVGLNIDAASSLAGKEGGSDIQRLEALDAMIGRGEFDLVAVGRALLADPEWVLKIKEDRPSQIRTFSREALLTLN